MSLDYPTALSGRTFRMLDAVLVLWVAGWIVLAWAVSSQVRGLSDLSDTLGTAATAVDQTSQALQPLQRLPFVGDELGRVAARAHNAAASARASASASRDTIRRLAILLGLSVAIAPTVPLVAVYAPLRAARIRDLRDVRRALGAGSGDPSLEEFLARRAAHRLPLGQLRRISANPWRDLEEGRYQDLARAELRRLGLHGSIHGPVSTAPDGSRG